MYILLLKQIGICINNGGINMDKQRLSEILKQERINEIYYNDCPVWVQEIHDTHAKIRFFKWTKGKRCIY